MRFMMLMIPKGYEKATPGTVPDANAVAAMMKYNESLQKAGALLSLDGLHPPSEGARISFSGGKSKVTLPASSRTRYAVKGRPVLAEMNLGSRSVLLSASSLAAWARAMGCCRMALLILNLQGRFSDWVCSQT